LLSLMDSMALAVSTVSDGFEVGMRDHSCKSPTWRVSVVSEKHPTAD
jgi:hypothetical protein